MTHEVSSNSKCISLFVITFFLSSIIKKTEQSQLNDIPSGKTKSSEKPVIRMSFFSLAQFIKVLITIDIAYDNRIPYLCKPGLLI